MLCIITIIICHSRVIFVYTMLTRLVSAMLALITNDNHVSYVLCIV